MDVNSRQSYVSMLSKWHYLFKTMHSPCKRNGKASFEVINTWLGTQLIYWFPCKEKKKKKSGKVVAEIKLLLVKSQGIQQDKARPRSPV